MLVARDCHSAIGVSSKYIIATGASDPQNSMTSEYFNCQNNSWHLLQNLNTPRCLHSSCEFKTKEE